MARMPRIHIEGALYYVSSYGDHNESIFNDNEDYINYLELLQRYKNQYGFKLFSFCLLPNHLHLLIELKEGLTISQIMHDLNSNYTKYFNGRYEKKGHLFKERYKMVLIEKDSYLLSMTAYIHLHPLRSGLAKSINEYLYTSIRSFLYSSTATKEIYSKVVEDETKEVFKFLGSKSYKDFIDNASKDEMETLRVDLSKKNIIGSESFIEKVKSEVDKLEAVDASQEERAKERVNKKFVLVGGAVIFILIAATALLYGKTAILKKDFQRALTDKEKQMDTRIAQEKSMVYKNLDSKYRADTVSLEAMAKRLELEKQKTIELENKIKEKGAGKPKK